MRKDYFQQHMPENVCFGCGVSNEDGLHVQSYWEGEEAVCTWHSQEKYHGWANLLNGGILATIIDCHCMGTAMADAYRREDRPLDSAPTYRYATGTITVKYLKPTPNEHPIELRAQVTEVKGKKTVMTCTARVNGEVTASADVIAIRVFDSSTHDGANPFK
ncbi:MAG: PaaI family thioesterase [Marinoscillum sp.]|uniref:PaaI family thioesterase n=1 Tax=Marinoscillum sp. TaxID=2024838 RepID=UPI0032FA6FC3